MVADQKHMHISSDLVPYCPVCGAPMSMNLRADDTFVEDSGWHRAADRYQTKTPFSFLGKEYIIKQRQIKDYGGNNGFFKRRIERSKKTN